MTSAGCHQFGSPNRACAGVTHGLSTNCGTRRGVAVALVFGGCDRIRLRVIGDSRSFSVPELCAVIGRMIDQFVVGANVLQCLTGRRIQLLGRESIQAPDQHVIHAAADLLIVGDIHLLRHLLKEFRAGEGEVNARVELRVESHGEIIEGGFVVAGQWRRVRSQCIDRC